ncbi:hypothetical protein [Psychroflexus maritimus]|uniref:Uncharacterized protein n=1 Tax=Psychroflexus maritimus TaxID=2714865 RepID=A0A967AG16_9FLAO|nr:hypothetical protein [Psychroflexus maritimus]NGZ90568.1 hypothetical protein [Psychroflexus maritimus]
MQKIIPYFIVEAFDSNASTIKHSIASPKTKIHQQKKLNDLQQSFSLYILCERRDLLRRRSA